MTDTNPPVGATVDVGKVRWHWLASPDHNFACWFTSSDDQRAWRYCGALLEDTITTAWRMQQRAEQAEAENDARWEQVKRYVRAVLPDCGCLTGDCPHTLQTECDVATDGLITEALAELAKLRALAVEAKATEARLGDPNQTPQQALRDLDAVSCTHGKLAALATPNQEPTP